MKTYILRSLRYLLKLLVIIALVWLLLDRADMARDGGLKEVFLSDRGLMLATALLVLAAFYPRMGYVSRFVEADIEGDREEIIKAFRMGNYAFQGGDGERMTFRASSMWKRLIAVWDDKVVVTAQDNGIVISGLRKEVVKVEFRLCAMVGGNEKE